MSNNSVINSSANNERTSFQYDPRDLPGATRIGNVWLHVPPINLRFGHAKATDLRKVLRQSGPEYVKSGRGVKTVDIDLVFSGANQINNKLARILATLRRTPFIIVNNETICKEMNYQSNNAINNDVPMAVTAYTFRTELELPDTIIMHLSMMFFNFLPYVKTFQYLKHTGDFNKDGTPTLVPCQGIEDSNLYRQYVDALLKKSVEIGDFMFGGEIDSAGSLSPEELAKQKNAKNEFNSRIDFQRSDVVRNGSVIRLTDNYDSAKQDLVIGYHVFSLAQALDLKLGAYKSRRLHKWVWTEDDLRKDMKLCVTNLPDSMSVTQAVTQYYEELMTLPVINNGAKYPKKFRISTNNTCVIHGLAVRRSINLTPLPILSCETPTIQYTGGAVTDISLTLVVNDENFIEQLRAVDSSIEESSRNKRHLAGTEMSYIENDLVNLNGTFTIHTGDMDIQNIPGNPGSYMVNWNFNEQTEGLYALTSPPNEIPKLKQTMLEQILTVYRNWQYTDAYNKKRHDLNFDDIDPSYIKIFVIPSLIRSVRNGFVEFMKQNGYVNSSDFTNESISGVLDAATAMITQGQVQTINFDYLWEDPPFVDDGSVSETADDQETRYETAYNKIWHLMTGQLGTSDINKDTNTTTLYQQFKYYLYAQLATLSGVNATNTNTETGMIKGTAALLARSNNRRFELFLRQPNIREYEIKKMMGNTSSGTSTGSGYYWTSMMGEKVYYDDLSIRDYVSSLADACAEYTIDEKPLFKQPTHPDLTEAELRQGSIYLLRGDDVSNAAFKELMRPHIEKWIARHSSSGANIGSAKDAFSTFLNATSKLTCYPDLGLPFDYDIEKADGTKTGKFITFTEPDFYIQSYSIKDIGGIDDSDISLVAIKKRLALASQGIPTLAITGNTVPSIERTNGMVNNDIRNSEPYKPLGSTSKTTSSPKDIQQREIDLLNNSINKELATTKAYYKNAHGGNISPGEMAKLRNNETDFSMLSDAELFMTTALAKTVGNIAGETSPKTIDEAMREHKIFHSTYMDYNPDFEHTLPNIIEKAQNQILENPKYYSMAGAYPTFKLYFRAENQNEWLLFDNFFDYRMISSIRIFKDKGSPSTSAVIEMVNQKNVLNDLTALLAKSSHLTADGNNASANKLDYTSDQGGSKPLAKLMLQAGTAVSIRVGYNSDPDLLSTLFNGYITGVDPGEAFTIECQSYGAELDTESNMTSITGRFCHPGQYLWMMMTDPKVKHLGHLFEAKTLPNSAKDYLDWAAFGHNIYINDTMEPGKLRYLQAYNAENMSKWDVFQDMAAAHPGYICQVVPYGNRETVFFGKPDHFYTYTDDPGVTRNYSLPYKNDSGTPSSLKTFINSCINGAADSYGPQPAGLDVMSTADYKTAWNSLQLGNFSVNLNYMQWKAYGDSIKDIIDINKQAISQTKKYDIFVALQYCRLVEYLTALDADPAVGNIQYRQISLTGQADSVDSLSSNALKSAQASQTTALKTYLQSLSASELTNTIQTVINNYSEDPSINPSSAAQYDNKLTKLRADVLKIQTNPSYMTSFDISKYDNKIQAAFTNSLKNRTVHLQYFLTGGTEANRELGATWSNMSKKSFQDSSYDFNILEVNPDLQSAEELMLNYKNTKDPDIISQGMFSDSTHVTRAFFKAAQATYNETGIASPIACACWYRIAFLLFGQLRKKTGQKGNQTVTYMNDINNLQDYSSTGLFFDSLGIQVFNTDDAGVTTDQLGTVKFNGPIFRTDLKAHIALRNIILGKLTSFSADLQELLFTLGQAPNKKTFRNYKILTSHEHIINNSIKLDYIGMWNAVKLKYKRHDFMDVYIPSPVIGVANAVVTAGSYGMLNLGWGDKPNSYVIQAGQTLDDRITREITIPIENARTVAQARNYSTSLLAEGIRNMYSGNLVIRGDPELKPTDICFIYDDYNAMYGAIEVKSVLNLFTPDTGYITVIEPQAYVEPLGINFSAAALICEVFNDILTAVAVIGAAETFGASLGLLGEKAALTTAVKELTTTDKALNTVKSLFSQGASVTDEVSGWLGSKGTLAGKFYAQAYNDGLKSTITSFANSYKLNVSYADVVNGVNAIRATEGTAAVTDLYGVSTSEISSALKTLCHGQINADGTAVATDTMNKAVDAFASKLTLTSGVAAAKTASAVGVSTLKDYTGLIKGTFAKASGVTTLNMIKTMAGAGTVAYIQMFAGMDDSNYACPLRISPLSWRNDPFVCGLDGLTRESGILNYVKGQWKLYMGSVTTISDYITQYMDGISQTLDL